jgi:tetratricopeptide (TPR) repeat protein
MFCKAPNIMSLIIAKKLDRNIFIVSDTKLTNPQNINHVEFNTPEEFCAIKTIILNPYVTISFAGETGHAKIAIAHCRKLNDKITEILVYLLQTNINSNDATEFIVCVNLPPFFIYEIKKSRCEPTSSAWIGDSDGFNEFQSHFLKSDKPDLLSKMEDAFNGVIESDVKSVNGFLITVTNENHFFSYKQYMRTYIPSRTYVGNSIIEVYGTVQEGGYTINLFSDEKNEVLAIHLRQNDYGLIYVNKDDSYLEPIVHKDVDEHEFNEITEAKYGIKPPFLMSPKQRSYLTRGNKYATKQEFIKAIEFYDLGLKETEKELIADLHFNKGQCQFQLGRQQEAALSFNAAVKANSNFLQKVFNFINQFRNKM